MAEIPLSKTPETRFEERAYEPVNLRNTINTVSARVAELNPTSDTVQNVIEELAATARVTLYIPQLAEQEIRRRLRGQIVIPGQHPRAPISR